MRPLLRLRRKIILPQDGQSQIENIPTTDGGAVVQITRGRTLVEEIAVLKPNQFHAVILRGPSGFYGESGSIEDLGVSNNLRTNAGINWQADTMSGRLPGTLGSPATGTSATSLTVTGTPLVANALRGFKIYADQSTNSPVYGNIGSNTTSVITVDQWWNSDDTLGTTPSSTAAFAISPGMTPARFIGLTTDTGVPAAGDTTLASEITTNGLQRALATYAHTTDVASFTLAKTYTAAGAFTAVHKAGLFTCLTTTAGGVLAFETLLNADATLAIGDSIATTWTVNI